MGRSVMEAKILCGQDMQMPEEEEVSHCDIGGGRGAGGRKVGEGLLMAKRIFSYGGD